MQNPRTTERYLFFVALKRLAEIHGQLPDSVMITEEIRVSNGIYSLPVDFQMSGLERTRGVPLQ